MCLWYFPLVFYANCRFYFDFFMIQFLIILFANLFRFELFMNKSFSKWNGGNKIHLIQKVIYDFEASWLLGYVSWQKHVTENSLGFVINEVHLINFSFVLVFDNLAVFLVSSIQFCCHLVKNLLTNVEKFYTFLKAQKCFDENKKNWETLLIEKL